MRFKSRLFRASLWLATTSLSLASVAPGWAQPAAPGDAAPTDAAPGAAGDPPALAGRVSAVTGTVSTHGAGETDWVAAAVNTPVTTGDSFWTQPQSTATIEIGGDHFVLNEATELDIAQLDQSQFTGSAAQGEMFLSLPELPQGQSFTINTPRGGVQITATGQYDIVAGDTATPTTVTVFSGSAQVTGNNVNLAVAANQQATITGTDQLSGTVGPASPDAFARAQLSSGAPPALPAAVPAQVRYMTGGADLAQYGNWQATADYGQVWYPSNVPSDWAPYREGRWSYVGPWGWTWVDQEPWGFAPFHYGRWVDYGGRWGWVAAAPDAPVGAFPVYAPALVGFVGFGGAALAGFSVGFGARFFAGGGGVGWVPLGFREPYRPWYHVSDRYLQNINRVSVVNVRNITVNNFRNVTINHYANARGATIVPAAAMTRGEPLRGIARPLPAADLTRGEPVVGRLPVRPTAETPGLTRAEARRYNVALPAHPAGRVAPGPAFRPGGSFAHPALRPAEAAHGVPAGRIGGERGAHPGLPPLRPAAEAHTRPPITPFGGAHRGPEEGRQAAPAPQRPESEAHRAATAPEAHRTAPERLARAPRPETRPARAPEHLAPHAEARHAPEVRPAPRPAPHPEARHAPEAHPAPRPASHPEPRHAPEAHPAPRPAPHPAPEKHPR